MTRQGLLGGTFDPIHHGHLDVAEAARLALRLDRVVLVPSHIPPHRRAPQASAAHRFAMAALAVQNRDALRVSDLEIAADGPSFTASTLDRLAAQGIDTKGLFFITGADAFRDIRTWRHFPAILDRCHFVAVSRPGCPAVSLRTALPELANRMVDAPCSDPSSPGIFLVEATTAAVSSTDVRQRVADGAPLSGMVPDAVAGHIVKHGLYRTPRPGTVA
jgi:nicotinate-nucleotide adenylyltransferase